MATIPNKNILNGTSTPTVAQMKIEMGKLWDYLNSPEIPEPVYAAKHAFLNGADSSFSTQTTGGLYNTYTLGNIFYRNTLTTSGAYYRTGVASDISFFIYNQSNVGVYLAYGGTSWTSTSDEKTKDIIEPITDAANKVSTLRAVIGKYKNDDPNTRRSFLIAQDVQAVLPEAVSETDGVLGLSYTDTIPLLVAAIKELKAEIDILKGA